MCVKCALVEMDSPTTAALEAFQSVRVVRKDRTIETSKLTSRNNLSRRGPDGILGLVHHDHPANSTRMQLVWSTVDV